MANETKKENSAPEKETKKNKKNEEDKEAEMVCIDG